MGVCSPLLFSMGPDHLSLGSIPGDVPRPCPSLIAVEARRQANLAPLTRCSSLPLGRLVVGQLGEGLASARTSQPILSESQAALGNETVRARKAQKKAQNEVPPKKLWCVRSGRCKVLAPGRLLTCRDRCFRFSRQPCCLLYGSDRPAGDRRTGLTRL